MRKRELPCPPNLVYKVLERFRQHHASDAPDCTDGVRVAWGDSWLHVRASGTEPLLRIIAESPDQGRAETLAEEATVFARRIAFGHEGS
jgi:phosphomannomutase